MESSIEYFHNDNKDYYCNKNIIVTGATGGIGSILVESLYKLGANLLLISHDEEKLKAKFNNSFGFRSSVGGLNQPQYEIIDLEKPREITKKFHSVMKKLNARLDILFICHGKYKVSTINDCDIMTYDNIMNINVRSVFHLLSLSVPFLKLTKGNCVIISSMESFIPVKGGFLNTTSKAMLNSLVQNAALELSSFGVRVNAVAPGITDTEHRVSGNEVDKSINENFLKNSGNSFLLGQKILQPSNIVDTILFLGSDDASFITGEIIQNDNGYSLNHDLSFTNKDNKYLNYS